jgi:hypothetical protein
MPVFLVESYLPDSANAHEEAPASARRAAELAAKDGVAFRHLRTTLLPADETCFHFFEAASLAVVETAAARAGLTCDRIVEAREQRGEGRNQ